MQQFLQLALAITLLVGGGGWLYAQIFLLHEMLPLPVAAATVATFGGAAWLYGDFIFPMTRGGQIRQNDPDPRKHRRATQ